MLGKQAIVRLKVALNKLDTSSNRTVRPEQALLFLNNAYEKLAKAKYTKQNNIQDITAFQYNQVTTDELNHLTKVESIAPNNEGDIYYINVEDITNYWIHLRSELLVKVGNKQKWISNPTYRTLDTLGPTMSDPFNESHPSSPIIFYEDNKVKSIGNNFEILKHKITFYRKPEEIVLDQEIKAPFVQEIIDTAAVMILENWTDGRTESKLAVNKTIENE